MDIRRRMFFRKKESSSGGSTTEGSYTVNLNGQWEATTAVPNPDSTLYDGVYRSSSNYNVNSGVATMYITIKDCSSFKMYIRSYAESNYDYVMVSQLDQTITGKTSYNNTSLVKAHTRGNHQPGTALSNYTLVEFTGITSGMHTIMVVYRKDGSGNIGEDRGYVLIPKSNVSSGGDIEIDTTYAIYYTSSDGNIVTLYETGGFGANITNNVYINGQGIISFDGPITTIGNHAFYQCKSLTSVSIPDSVTTIGSYAFSDCSSLTSVNIPDSVTSIGDLAFYDCSNLTSVNIPDSVTMIGRQAFYNCSSLTSVNIPDSVTTIGSYAFSDCDSLTSITIPDSVTTIGDGAFYSCTSLASVYCKATTPPALGGTSVFDNNGSGRKIYVPTGSVNAYKRATRWNEYASAIVGYNF